MNDGGFLVARLHPESVIGSMAWIATDGVPFEPVDPLDFLNTEAGSVFDLYREAYMRVDNRLNVGMPDALLEYNRWILLVDQEGSLLAFACYKTTENGLKLGLTTSVDDLAAKTALKIMLREGLNVEGVYAEVSEGVERVVVGHVPEVPVTEIARILHKTIEPDEDGRHYRREITNVGPKTKLLVGRPLHL